MHLKCHTSLTMYIDDTNEEKIVCEKGKEYEVVNEHVDVYEIISENSIAHYFTKKPDNGFSYLDWFEPVEETKTNA